MMSRSTAFLLLLCVLAVSLLASPACALRQSGSVSASSTFQYVSKFVFAQHEANFTSASTSTLPQGAPSSQHIILYPDTLWSTVLASTNCSEQLSLGKGGAVGVPLHVEVLGQRPHWWYVALLDCEHGNSTGLGMQYAFHFTNGGGLWTDEVSYNEQHVAETSLAFFLFFLLLTPLFAASAVRARSTHTRVPHLLLTAIAACLCLAYLLYAVEYLTLVRSGEQYVSLSSAAYFFQQFAASMLVFSILSTCAGYPLSRPSIAYLPVVLGTACLVFGLYVASYVVRQFTQPVWSTQYVFDNPAGYTLAILYGLLVPACFALLRSTRRLPNPAAAYSSYFHATYLLFALCYLLSFPFITLGTSLADSWWVAKAELAATGAVLCLAVLGQWVFFQPFHTAPRTRRFKTLDEPEEEVSKVAVIGEPSVLAGQEEGEQGGAAAEGGEAESGDVELSVHRASVSGSVVPV